jgi:hypothetical protein
VTCAVNVAALVVSPAGVSTSLTSRFAAPCERGLLVRHSRSPPSRKLDAISAAGEAFWGVTSIALIGWSLGRRQSSRYLVKPGPNARAWSTSTGGPGCEAVFGRG